MALAPGCGLLKRAMVIAQRNIHINFAALGAEAEDYSFGIFAALGALLGGMNRRRMHSKVEALVVKDSDRISDNLIGQFADRFAD